MELAELVVAAARWQVEEVERLVELVEKAVQAVQRVSKEGAGPHDSFP